MKKKKSISEVFVVIGNSDYDHIDDEYFYNKQVLDQRPIDDNNEENDGMMEDYLSNEKIFYEHMQIEHGL